MTANNDLQLLIALHLPLVLLPSQGCPAPEACTSVSLALPDLPQCVFNIRVWQITQLWPGLPSKQLWVELRLCAVPDLQQERGLHDRSHISLEEEVHLMQIFLSPMNSSCLWVLHTFYSKQACTLWVHLLHSVCAESQRI